MNMQSGLQLAYFIIVDNEIRWATSRFCLQEQLYVLSKFITFTSQNDIFCENFYKVEFIILYIREL
ncbi:hypothetical protein D1953_00590 [Peribacillus asahii]|uniref:Uncharacterized protein n=1 Tax=Peribacillus asahii TaxID=228899 RepID=A0A398BP16_9BACI|nr:hypothetical protein D1953_00590 [Peribacillus asahii]